MGGRLFSGDQKPVQAGTTKEQPVLPRIIDQPLLPQLVQERRNHFPTRANHLRQIVLSKIMRQANPFSVRLAEFIGQPTQRTDQTLHGAAERQGLNLVIGCRQLLGDIGKEKEKRRPIALQVGHKFVETQFVIRVKVREVFPNCPRYIHKYQLVERSKYVPHVGVETPTPAWKSFDWAKDVLPQDGHEKEKGDER